MGETDDVIQGVRAGAEGSAAGGDPPQKLSTQGDEHDEAKPAVDHNIRVPDTRKPAIPRFRPARAPTCRTRPASICAARSSSRSAADLSPQERPNSFRA